MHTHASYHFTQTAPKIFGGVVRTHLLAFYPKDHEKASTFEANLRTVAPDFKGKVWTQRKEVEIKG